MIEGFLLWACILVIFVGVIVIGGIIWIGYKLFRYKTNKNFPDPPFWAELLHYFHHEAPHAFRSDIPRYLYDSYTEYLQRRNEFWTAFGQILIAVLIVVVLSILLITKSISAEAGLPILSGISGFAIAKGVSAGKGLAVTQDRQKE